MVRFHLFVCCLSRLKEEQHFDFKRIAKFVWDCASSKTVPAFNRKRLYAMAQKIMDNIDGGLDAVFETAVAPTPTIVQTESKPALGTHHVHSQC
jgi:hypothetical protein